MDLIGRGWSAHERPGLGDCTQPWGRPVQRPSQPSDCVDRRGGVPDPLSIVVGLILKNVPIPRR
jgi:hypothetical protein